MRETLKTIAEKEWKLIIILCIFLLIITNIPYIYGFLTPPENYVYNGLHALAPVDYPFYYSLINQIKSGNALIYNVFTSETQTVGTFNIFWLCAGLFAKIFNLIPSIAIQVIRTLLIIPCVLTIYLFIAYFFRSIYKRTLAFIFILFSSGLGVFFNSIIMEDSPPNTLYISIDQWLSDSNTFTILYQVPHFIAALTLIILIYFYILKTVETKKIKYLFYSGLFGLILFNFHPYHFVSINFIFAIFLILLLLRKKIKFLNALIYFSIWFAVSAPSVIYHYYLIKTDEIIGGVAVQNICITPPFIYILTGFGLLFIFAVIGIWKIIKNKQLSEKNLLIITWFIAGLISIYLPIAFQRRLAMGIHIPICILSVIAITSINNIRFKYLLKNKVLALYLFLVFFCITNLFHITRDMIYFHNKLSTFYTSNNELEAIKFLEKNNTASKIIINPGSDLFTIKYILIPAVSDLKMYLGHGHGTINSQKKYEELLSLYKKNKPTEWLKFFQKNNIGYIYINKPIDSAFKLIDGYFTFPLNNTEKIYENKEILIYKIIY